MKKLNNSGHFHLLLSLIAVVVGVTSYGSYQYVRSYADTQAGVVHINTAKGCWLAGRIWDAGSKKQKDDGYCKPQCRVSGTELRVLDGTTRKYCNGHVAFFADAQRCAGKLNRYYIAELNGCARKPDQLDGNGSEYCQPGYPYYNADFNNKELDKKTLVDVCEKSKRVATMNENQGTIGVGQPANNSGGNSGGSQGNSGSGGNAGQPSSGGSNSSKTIVVGSYNILGAENHNASSHGVGRCGNTSMAACASIRTNRQITIITGKASNPAFDIFGTQETSPTQYHQLKDRLKDFAVYPTDSSRMTPGKDGTDAVWWNNTLFKRVDQGKTRGISNTAQQITTPWVKLQLRGTTKTVYVVSIHYPIESLGGTSEVIRTASSLTSGWVRSKASKDTPVIVTGDFNDHLGDKLSYCILTKNGLMYNSWDVARGKKTPANCPSTKDNNGVDQIYYTPGRGLKAVGWKKAASVYPYNQSSDHMPVYAKMQW